MVNQVEMKGLFNEAFIEKVEEDCLSNLYSYFRETNLDNQILELYKYQMILQEQGYMDVSEIEGGMPAMVRYHIYSALDENFTESRRAPRALRMERNCFFKVLGVYSNGRKAVIVLLHIPEYAVPYFAVNQHPMEKQLFLDAKARFITALETEVDPVKKDPYWLKRTAFPVGISSAGTYFYNFDYTGFESKSPFYKPKTFLQRLLKK